MMEALEFIQNGGETVRFHTWPVLRQQRVDSHSWSVAMLCSLMALDADPGKGRGLSVPLLMAALTHDMAEHKMGDMPAPVKRSLPAYRTPEGEEIPFRAMWDSIEQKHLVAVGMDWEHALEPQEKRWLKLADTMDGCLYCIRERMLGNKLMAVPFTNHRQYIRDVGFGPDNDLVMAPMEQQIINYIDDMWEQANG